MAEPIHCPACGAALPPRPAPPAAGALAGTAEFVVPATLSGSSDGLESSPLGPSRIAPDPLLDLVGRMPAPAVAEPSEAGKNPGWAFPAGLSVHDVASNSWPGIASADDLGRSPTPFPPARRLTWPVALLAAYAVALTMACAWLLWSGRGREFKASRKAATHAAWPSPSPSSGIGPSANLARSASRKNSKSGAAHAAPIRSARAGSAAISSVVRALQGGPNRAARASRTASDRAMIGREPSPTASAAPASSDFGRFARLRRIHQVASAAARIGAGTAHAQGVPRGSGQGSGLGFGLGGT